MSDIVQHDESPKGWREFQEELKKSQLLTGAGVQQVLVGALRSRVEELERRGVLEPNPASKESELHPSYWRDSFRHLPLANKRGTMNTLMSGLGEEVQETMQRSTSVAHGPITPTTPSRHVNVAATTTARRATASAALSSSTSRTPSATRSRTLHQPPNPSTFLSSHHASMAQLSSQATKEVSRRGSMFADMLRLEDETKYSMSQALTQGSYINRGGSAGLDFASTTDYSDVIHRKMDSERLESGSYTASSDQGSTNSFTAAMNSAFDTAKAIIEVAKSA